MLSNLEQHFTVESLHHEIPHEEEDDSLSSDDSSHMDHGDQDDSTLDLPWNDEEDELLVANAESMDPKNWTLIAEQIPGRTNRECKRRWAQLQRSGDGRSRAPWTKEEDEMLKELVAQHGSKAWKLISSMMSGRKSKQCRERWTNVVDPKLNYAPWTEEEEQILILAQQELGNKWSQIEKRLPGRSANSIKNYWYSALRRGERKRAKMERKAMQPEGKKRRPRKPKAPVEEEVPIQIEASATEIGLSESDDKPKKKGIKRKKKDEVAEESAIEGVQNAALAVEDIASATVIDDSSDKPSKKAKKAKDLKVNKPEESLEATTIAMADNVDEEPKKSSKAKKTAKSTTGLVPPVVSSIPVEIDVPLDTTLAAGSVDDDSNGKSGKRKAAKPTEEEKLLKPAAKKRRKNIAITDDALSS